MLRKLLSVVGGLYNLIARVDCDGCESTRQNQLQSAKTVNTSGPTYGCTTQKYNRELEEGT